MLAKLLTNVQPVNPSNAVGDKMNHYVQGGPIENCITRSLLVVAIFRFRPVMIDIPHFASLRDVTRKLVVWRSFDGDKWTRHDDVITSRDYRTGSDDDVDLVRCASDRLTSGLSLK